MPDNEFLLFFNEKLIELINVCVQQVQKLSLRIPMLWYPPQQHLQFFV